MQSWRFFAAPVSLQRGLRASRRSCRARQAGLAFRAMLNSATAAIKAMRVQILATKSFAGCFFVASSMASQLAAQAAGSMHDAVAWRRGLSRARSSPVGSVCARPRPHRA